jgi:L-serine dehydratase
MLSVFDLFSVGIGPSSSHTVAPMRAARAFLESLDHAGSLGDVCTLSVELYGSLAATGRAHGTGKALLLGFEGEDPATVDVATIGRRVAQIRRRHRVSLLGRHEITFEESTDVILHRDELLPIHPNAMRFSAWRADGSAISSRTSYSIGGGFVLDDITAQRPAPTKVPHPFTSAGQLLHLCETSGLRISDVVLENEQVLGGGVGIHEGLMGIWQAMKDCVEQGCSTDGTLPGFMKLNRRAPELARQLAQNDATRDPLRIMDWVNCFALAVSEENAAGGRVVTAPTNGAAGIIPAVLLYYDRFVPGAGENGIVRFLLVAGAIGTLCKANASISGAEVGCQGEVGSACAMAAAGLTEAVGGTPLQVENAAEIAIEHNLGLTCDPVGGYVQVPCIERNAMAAVKAINASRLALRGDGRHAVSLDKALLTMRQTGEDMKTKYKETARGGLALNITEC